LSAGCRQSKAGAQVKDLMNRLNNAVKQRNAAREEALLASEKLKKLEEDLESGRLAPAGPGPTPGAATPLGTPTADGAAPDEPGALSVERERSRHQSLTVPASIYRTGSNRRHMHKSVSTLHLPSMWGTSYALFAFTV
jgi:hypothetical protein